MIWIVLVYSDSAQSVMIWIVLVHSDSAAESTIHQVHVSEHAMA